MQVVSLDRHCRVQPFSNIRLTRFAYFTIGVCNERWLVYLLGRHLILPVASMASSVVGWWRDGSSSRSGVHVRVHVRVRAHVRACGTACRVGYQHSCVQMPLTVRAAIAAALQYGGTAAGNTGTLTVIPSWRPMSLCPVIPHPAKGPTKPCPDTIIWPETGVCVCVCVRACVCVGGGSNMDMCARQQKKKRV